jgi:hypothetical protein
MRSVLIKTNLHSGDCEDCGFYGYGDFEIVFDGESVLSGGYDGHLGGGNWDGRVETLYQWALAKLGFRVHENGVAEQVPTYFGYDNEIEELFDGDPTPLSVKYITQPLPDYPEYDDNAGAWLPPLVEGGAPMLLVTNWATLELRATGSRAWDGSMREIYRLLLDQRCNLTLEEVGTDDDDSMDSDYDDDLVEDPARSRSYDDY